MNCKQLRIKGQVIKTIQIFNSCLEKSYLDEKKEIRKGVKYDKLTEVLEINLWLETELLILIAKKFRGWQSGDRFVVPCPLKGTLIKNKKLIKKHKQARRTADLGV